MNHLALPNQSIMLTYTQRGNPKEVHVYYLKLPIALLWLVAIYIYVVIESALLFAKLIWYHPEPDEIASFIENDFRPQRTRSA